MRNNTTKNKKSDYQKIDSRIFKAWKSLKKHPHKRTVGVDDVSIEAFAKNERANIGLIRKDLRSNSYEFESLKLKEIPKGSGKGKRPLLLATVRDRIVSKAILSTVGSNIKRKYPSKVSYCSVIPKDNRRKINTLQDGVRVVKESFASGYRYFYETDISNFFNQIDKEEILKEIKPLVDVETYSLIKQIINFDVVGENSSLYFEPGYAIAQGSSLSPLLADIYLNNFDKFLEEISRTGDFIPIRYVDDLVILTKSKHQAESLDSLVRGELKKRNLETKIEKTHCGARSTKSFKFLGIVFSEDRLSLPSGKKKKILREIKETLNAKSPKSLPKKLEKVTSRLTMNIKYYQRIDADDFNRQLIEIVNDAESMVQDYFRDKQKEILGVSLLDKQGISAEQRLEYFRFLGLKLDYLRNKIQPKKKG